MISLEFWPLGTQARNHDTTRTGNYIGHRANLDETANIAVLCPRIKCYLSSL